MENNNLIKENKERNDKKFIWFRVHWIGRCLTYFVVGVALACAIVFPILGNRSTSTSSNITIENMSYLTKPLLFSLSNDVKEGNTYTLKVNIKDLIDYSKQVYEPEQVEGHCAFHFASFNPSAQVIGDLIYNEEKNNTFEYFERDSFTVKYGSNQLTYNKNPEELTEEQMRSIFFTDINGDKQPLAWFCYYHDDDNYNVEISMKCIKSGNVSMKLMLWGE